MISIPSRLVFSIPVALLLASSMAMAQQPPQTPSDPPKPPSTVPPPGDISRPTVPSRDQLEKEFQESLTGAVLEGVWQMTGEGGLKGVAPLTDPKPDKYAIASAKKINDDTWVINARIQFGDKDVTVPVPVRVVWAEDTAVITLNDLAIPMIGTYTARVMIHHGFYSGVWYCGQKNYGGVMQGRIIKEAAAKEKTPSDK